MFSPTTPSRMVALIEVDGTDPAEIPSELIRDAYRASRFGLIGLWLRGTSPQAVDRILDPMVAAHGTHVHGVCYLSAEDETSVAGAAGARLAVASSEPLRTRLADLGIPSVRPDEVGLRLADYLQPEP